MQNDPTGLVTVPSVDTPQFFSAITHFFLSHGSDWWHLGQNLVGAVVAISIPVSIFFLIMIVFTVEGIKHIRHLEEERYMEPTNPPEAAPPVTDKINEEQARRWRKVSEHLNSSNPNDWRQAIIEADI